MCSKFLLSPWALAELQLVSVGCCKPGGVACTVQDLLGLVRALTSCLFSALSPAAGTDREQRLVVRISPLAHASCYEVCNSYYTFSQKWGLISRPLLFLLWPLLIPLLTVASN